MAPQSLWVVIAAYNEATVIAGVIAGVKQAGYPVVVVDDGSRDGTGDAAETAGAIVVRHPINLGQGAALQTGIEFALSSGAEIIATFDGDGQHRVSDIAALAAALTQHDADYALGSRFLGDTLNQPLSRRVTLRLATWFTRLTVGISLTDTHNGLRAMTRRGAERIHLRQNKMAHASEILHQVAASGLKYVEVPVTIEYSAYSLAKGQKLSDALTILLDLFARRLHR
ncbi:MAG: glycosyltransferase family 2 protein [Pseudolabrys sp.]|nr:glycosyltransferase family 2 protein [Pseudolabrys sp.]